MSATIIPEVDSTRYEYRPYPGSGHRSPCPALNTLANHGYISRNGRDLGFLEIVRAVVLVYNISYPLAILLTVAGFITCGHVSFSNRPPAKEDQAGVEKAGPSPWMKFPFKYIHNLTMYICPRISLHLSALSQREGFKIAHDASFVHPNGVPSECPDPVLVQEFLSYASKKDISIGKTSGGLGLVDIARYHAQRTKSSPVPLGSLHRQVALGECALTWEALRGNCDESDYGNQGQTARIKNSGYLGAIPVSRLEQWFQEERLPDGWWDIGEGGVRPKAKIGLLMTRRLANFIGIMAGEGSYSKRVN